MEVHIKITFSAFALILMLVACSDKKTTQESTQWIDTSWTYLEGESIQFRKPNNLKRSSRYRIKQDMPVVAQDSVKLLLTQQALEQLEFDDSTIDVFVDTTTEYRFIVICNIERIDFRKEDIAMLKKQNEIANEQMEISNEFIQFGEVKATMSGNSNHKMAKLSNTIKQVIDKSVVLHTTYMLTGNAYSLVVFEISDTSGSIEKYLWTVK